MFTHRISAPALTEEAITYDAKQPYTVHRILGRLSFHHNLDLFARHTRPE